MGRGRGMGRRCGMGAGAGATGEPLRRTAGPASDVQRLKNDVEQLRQQLDEKTRRILQLEARDPKRRSN